MKYKDVRLSVIVPIYNVEKYLAECLDSIIYQTYTNMEIILVDDGSTDRSGIIADNFGKRDTRIKVIHKKNEGLLSARYVGGMAASGEYIAFVDSDDWIELNMYSFLMDKAETYQADLVTSGHYTYFSDDNVGLIYDRYIPEGMYEKDKIESEVIPIMMWDERIHGWALDPSTCYKIYRRDKLLLILEKLKNKKFYYGEDQAITYSYVLSAERIYCSNKPFYYYRQRKKDQVAPYFAADDFYQRLNDFYCFLYDEFKKHVLRDVLIKQLDVILAKSASHKLKKYNFQSTTEPLYLFPFDKIPFNAEFIIYGAGRTGRLYVKQIKALNYGKMVAWVDKYQRASGKISSPEIALQADFDYIVIAIVPETTVQEVKTWLLEMGVTEEKIIHQITEWKR